MQIFLAVFVLLVAHSSGAVWFADAEVEKAFLSSTISIVTEAGFCSGLMVSDRAVLAIEVRLKQGNSNNSISWQKNPFVLELKLVEKFCNR